MKDLGDFEKLDEMKTKLVEFSRLRGELESSLVAGRREHSHLEQFRSELDQLQQEKLAHVEELRHINNDINQLETTIKQAEGDNKRNLDTARTTFLALCPLRDEINSIRISLGVPLIPDSVINTEDVRKILTESFSSGGFGISADNVGGDNHLINNIPVSQQLAHAVSAQPHPHLISPFEMSPQPNLDLPRNDSSGLTFSKQQPPPMKVCTSCQQQIHRNAPICPLCKSKSRSRNPKKPKRRQDE